MADSTCVSPQFTGSTTILLFTFLYWLTNVPGLVIVLDVHQVHCVWPVHLQACGYLPWFLVVGVDENFKMLKKYRVHLGVVDMCC